MATHSSVQATYVLSIAGLAQDDVDDVTPLALCESGGAGMQPSAGSRFVGSYIGCIQPGSVHLGSQAVSPVSGDPKQGDLSFTVSLREDYPEIERFFGQVPRFPIARLKEGNDLDPTDTSFTVRAGEGANFAAQDVVYIGLEAFRVKSVASDVVTLQSDIPDPSTAGSYLARGAAGAHLVPGHIGTYIEQHVARAAFEAPPWPDDEVWGQSPFAKGREVVLFSADGTAETVEGRYFIQRWEVLNDGATLRVTCRDYLELLKARQFNTDRIEWIVESASEAYSGDFRILWLKPLTGRQAASIYDTGGAGQPYPGVLHADKTVLIATGADDLDEYAIQSVDGLIANARFACRSAARYRSEEPRSTDDLAGKKAYEVLVSDPDLFDDATEHPYYSTDLLAVAQHPIDLLRCHLGTLASNLPDHWKLDTPAQWIDDDELVRLRDTVFSDVSAFPGVFAGAKGKSYGALDWLWETFLAPLVSSWAVGPEGKLTVRTMRGSGGSDATPLTATHILMGRPVAVDADATFDTILASFGRGLDDDPAATYRIRGGVDRDWYRYGVGDREWTADAAWRPDAPFDPESGTAQTIVSLLTRQLQLQRQPLAVHTVRCTGAVRVYPGQFHEITGPGFRVTSTGLVAAGNVTLYGFVQGREVNPATHEQTLTVIEMPFANVRISASCDVTGVAGAVITCTEVEYIQPVNGGTGEYAYRDGQAVTEDVEQFGVDVDTYGGFECVIVSKRGVTKTDPFVLDSYSTAANTITATASVVGVGGGLYTWASGDRVELADYGDISKASIQTRYAFFEQSVYAL